MTPFSMAYNEGKIYICLADGKPVEIPKDRLRGMYAEFMTMYSHVKRKEDCGCKDKKKRGV